MAKRLIRITVYSRAYDSLSRVRMGEGAREGFRRFLSLTPSERALSLTLSHAYIGEGIRARKLTGIRVRPRSSKSPSTRRRNGRGYRATPPDRFLVSTLVSNWRGKKLVFG